GRRCRLPSPRWRGGGKWRRPSGRRRSWGRGRSGLRRRLGGRRRALHGRRTEGGGDLRKLAGVIQIVQAREQKRLAPVQRAEERVIDRDVEACVRFGGTHAVEERLPL